jgi:hypothetical protein
MGLRMNKLVGPDMFPEGRVQPDTGPISERGSLLDLPHRGLIDALVVCVPGRVIFLFKAVTAPTV